MAVLDGSEEEAVLDGSEKIAERQRLGSGSIESSRTKSKHGPLV